MNDCNPDDWRERKIREWLLLMLRLAITRDPRDRSAVLATADELDALGRYWRPTAPHWRPTAPRFFARTAGEVCNAIVGVGDNANFVLRKHIARIGDSRLRDAFAAAVDLDPEPSDYLHRSIEAPQHQSAKVDKREPLDLWRGLPRR